MKKFLAIILVVCSILSVLPSCTIGGTTVSAEVASSAEELYTPVSSKEENENDYVLQESFRDDYYWYYIYYLGRLHGIPVGDVSSNTWYEFTGATEDTLEFETTEMTTEKVATSIEKSNTVTDGWSKDITKSLSASLSSKITTEVKVGAAGQIGPIKLKGESGRKESTTNTIEKGLEEKYGISSSESNTLSQFVESSRETTLIKKKTVRFSFIPGETPVGHYRYITLGTADVFGLVIYDPEKNSASVTSISNWVFLSEKLLYSKNEFSLGAYKDKKLELPIDNLTFEEPNTYYECVPEESISNGEKKKVILNPNGGFVAQNEVNVVQNGTFGELPIPEKQGFVFVGWYTKLNGGDLIKPETLVQFEEDEITLYALWTKDATTITLGQENSDRHTIKKWSSWGNNEDRYGYDQIKTELNRDTLIGLKYKKIKVSMSFQYKVEDWGDQLIQIISNNGNEVVRFEEEWKECGWSNHTIEFELSLENDVGMDCDFDIKWYLFKDGFNSDTWYVGKTSLSITAVK